MNAVLISLLFVSLGMAGDDLNSLEDLYAAHPARVEGLFAQLDLDHAGLGDVKAAVEKTEWVAACRDLLQYYREAETMPDLRKRTPAPSEAVHEGVAPILAGVFTNYTISATVPRREDGGFDWTYNGPSGDLEWGWGLNRFPWAGRLVGAYFRTGNPLYAKTLDRYVRDWLLANPYPGHKTNEPQWRGLETRSRIGSALPLAFYSLQQTPDWSDATRILLLASVPEHAHYLRNFHAPHGNWVTMELNALSQAAIAWPEFRAASAWFDYAIQRMTPEIKDQVYPDGAQKELTSHYHTVSVASFEAFAKRAREHGREVPKAFTDGMENMNAYTAYTMRPSGFGLLNNDGDLVYNRDRIIKRAKGFKKPDWRYIATNGEEGIAPEGLPSRVFPWAGQLIMRSDWGRDAHWGFFDVGPLGNGGHRHFDKLHLSISAHGRDLLVDGGRYTYQGGSWREYFRGATSHNVLFYDGKRQQDRVNESLGPLSPVTYRMTPDYDFARGSLDGLVPGMDGEASQSRSVLYLRDQFWIVIDRVKTDRPRKITTLWHYAPDCTVEIEADSTTSTDAGKGNLRIIPAAGTDWSPRLIQGQESPEIQGWWSRKYNSKEPAPCVEYTTDIAGDATFVWALVPAKGLPPSGIVKILKETPADIHVEVTLSNGAKKQVSIPRQGTDIKIQ
jgi:hypothetical protein